MCQSNQRRLRSTVGVGVASNAGRAAARNGSQEGHQRSPTAGGGTKSAAALGVVEGRIAAPTPHPQRHEHRRVVCVVAVAVERPVVRRRGQKTPASQIGAPGRDASRYRVRVSLLWDVDQPYAFSTS